MSYAGEQCQARGTYSTNISHYCFTIVCSQTVPSAVCVLRIPLGQNLPCLALHPLGLEHSDTQ